MTELTVAVVDLWLEDATKAQEAARQEAEQKAKRRGQWR